MIAAPVKPLRDFSLLRQFNALHDVLEELLESRAVHNVADMLLVLYRVRIYVFLDISVGILDDLQDTLLIAPLDEVLREARISLAGTAEQDQTEIVLLAACPCSCRAVSYADAAADALGGIAHDFAVDE